MAGFAMTEFPVLMDVSSIWPCDCPDHAHTVLVLRDVEEWEGYISWLHRPPHEEELHDRP